MLDPESIDIYSLPWLPIELHLTFPNATAIYFAIDSEERLQYLGKTLSLKYRWRQHHKYQALVESDVKKVAFYFPNFYQSTSIKRSELARLEKGCIAWFKPPLNDKCRNLDKDYWQFPEAKELFEESPILECINSKTYHMDSPQVQNFYLWAVENKRELRDATKLTVSPRPIQALHRFLRFLGYETEKVGSFVSAGRQKNHYQIINPDLPYLETISSMDAELSQPIAISKIELQLAQGLEKLEVLK